MIVIYTQLTFGNVDNCLCNNTRDNIIEFPIKKVKNYTENLEFTRHGKPKAKPADSVKTLEEIEKLKNTLSNMKNNIMINDLSGITP